MITCTVHYEIDPDKLAEFEVYAKAWIHLVTRLGGTHHGYFLPHEGANDRASCHFSFPSLADYEDYRRRMDADPECRRVYAYARRTKCIRRYDRTFERSVLTGTSPAELDL